jgi:peptide/nickel transport system permease protein
VELGRPLRQAPGVEELRTYLLRRLLQTIPLLLGISALTFLLLQLAPGDFLATMADNPQVSPAALEAMRRRFGLDQPWWTQYLLYLKNVFLHLDFGESFSRHLPVFTVLKTGLANTLLLASAAAVVTWALAIPLGVVAAVRQYGWPDRALSFLAFLSLSVPEVLSGLLLLWFAASTGWFPVGSMRGLDHDLFSPAGRLADTLRHLVLPALTVGLIPLAGRMRQMRSSLLDVLRLDYVTTARAKGVPESQVILRHALRNALNPMITLFGFTLGSLVSGSFVAETIFSWPGLGSLTLEALNTQDQYLVMGSVLMASVVLIAGNLVADVLLALADPRIRHG